MILSCQNICKAFGEKVILNDASFHIEDREKAALIGCNGAGKTTLLRIIMQELSADSGTVVLARDKNIGYLASTRISADIIPSTRSFLPQSSTSSIWNAVSAIRNRK